MTTGTINASIDGTLDTIIGPGVYLTPFGPEYGKKFNAWNNYSTTLWQQKEDQGKLDCVIIITMSAENIIGKITNDGRYILVYKNNDLNLFGSNVVKVEFMFGPNEKVVYRQ